VCWTGQIINPKEKDSINVSEKKGEETVGSSSRIKDNISIRGSHKATFKRERRDWGLSPWKRFGGEEKDGGTFQEKL